MAAPRTRKPGSLANVTRQVNSQQSPAIRRRRPAVQPCARTIAPRLWRSVEPRSAGPRRLSLRRLRSVLAPRTHSALDRRRVIVTADHAVAHAGQVPYAPAADEDDRVLLQVVALARDERGDLLAVGEPHARDLPEPRVRFLRRHRSDDEAHAIIAGQQAAMVAMGPPPLATEEHTNHSDRHAFGIEWVWGIKRSVFNSVDFASMRLDTYAAAPAGVAHS